MRYAWNRSRAVDAQVVGERVSAIAEVSGGVCPPSALVEDARPSESLLHPLFEWDDWRAAEAHRRDQARRAIRELRVVQDTDAGEEMVQAFVHVIRVDDGEPVEGYRLTSLVVQSEEEYSQVLDEALGQLRAWKRRFAHLSELSSVFRALGRVV